MKPSFYLTKHPKVISCSQPLPTMQSTTDHPEIKQLQACS